MVEFATSLFELTLFLFRADDNAIVFVLCVILVICSVFAILSALLHRDFGRFLNDKR